MKKCGADAALRAEVEHLLKASGNTDPGFLEPPGIAWKTFEDLTRLPK